VADKADLLLFAKAHFAKAVGHRRCVGVPFDADGDASFHVAQRAHVAMGTMALNDHDLFGFLFHRNRRLNVDAIACKWVLPARKANRPEGRRALRAVRPGKLFQLAELDGEAGFLAIRSAALEDVLFGRLVIGGRDGAQGLGGFGLLAGCESGLESLLRLTDLGKGAAVVQTLALIGERPTFC